MNSNNSNSGLPDALQKNLQNLIGDAVRSSSTGNFEQAEAAITDVWNAVNEHFAEHPQNADSVHVRIEEKENAREWDEALALLRQVIANEGEDGSPVVLYPTWRNIARLSRQLGRPHDALVAAQSTVSAARRLPEMWFPITSALAFESECALELNQPREALDRVETAIALVESGKIYDRHRAELHILRAAAKVRLADLSGAEADLADIAPLVDSLRKDSLMNLGRETAMNFLAVDAALRTARGEHDLAVESRGAVATFWRSAMQEAGSVRIGWQLAYALRELAQALEAAGSPYEAANARSESSALLDLLRLSLPPEEA